MVYNTKQIRACQDPDTEIEPILTHRVLSSSVSEEGCNGPKLKGITIVTISDTHGDHRKLTMPPGDILIHAGDYTQYGKREHAEDFNAWLGEIRASSGSYQHIFVVHGNHEVDAPWKGIARSILSNATLLIDQSVDVNIYLKKSILHGDTDTEGEKEGDEYHSLKIHGMNFSWPILYGSDPRFDRISHENPPDILISHGPAQGYVDGNQGCPLLTKMVQRVRPQIVISGHIHSRRGIAVADHDDRGHDTPPSNPSNDINESVTRKRRMTTFVNSATAKGGVHGGRSIGKQPIVLLL